MFLVLCCAHQSNRSTNRNIAKILRELARYVDSPVSKTVVRHPASEFSLRSNRFTLYRLLTPSATISLMKIAQYGEIALDIVVAIVAYYFLHWFGFALWAFFV